MQQRKIQNTERIINLEKATKENTASINNLIKVRKKDRPELMDVLETINRSISKRFDEMEENINEIFDKIYLTNLNNDAEDVELKQALGRLIEAIQKQQRG